MMKLSLDRSPGRPLKILCLGAHCDDIEIGCGGTILKLLEEYHRSEVHWLVFSSNARRSKEARRSASWFLRAAKTKTIQIKAFRDTFFPFLGSNFRRISFSPISDTIFTRITG
jgi:LmbE family N-acetylglucosaminyl deacetylase